MCVCRRIGAGHCREAAVRADFGARKDSRDLSDWATDLLPSLLPTPASFSKANSWLDLFFKLHRCPLHTRWIKCDTGACGKEAQCYLVSEVGTLHSASLSPSSIRPACPLPVVSHIPTILPPSQLCPPSHGRPAFHSQSTACLHWMALMQLLSSCSSMVKVPTFFELTVSSASSLLYHFKEVGSVSQYQCLGVTVFVGVKGVSLQFPEALNIARRI